jgi:hypothetical protein
MLFGLYLISCIYAASIALNLDAAPLIWTYFYAMRYGSYWMVKYSLLEKGFLDVIY